MTENQIQPIQNTTFVPDIRPDLSEYSLDNLVSAYENVDHKASLHKGYILLAAREMLSFSTIEFGKWCDSVPTLCREGQKNLNRYMHVATFFYDKDMDGISKTACYEISSPKNAEVAEAVYEKVLHQNLSVDAVKELIQEEKLAQGIPVKIKKDSSVVKTIPDPESPYKRTLNPSLDEGESKFNEELKVFLEEYGIPAWKLIGILLDYYSCSPKRKPSIMRLHDILELIEDDESRDDDILDEQDHQELPEDSGTPEPLDSNTVSLQVPGTNHKQQRNDLCACGSGLKYKKCCLI